jgi:hypothetical protein
VGLKEVLGVSVQVVRKPPKPVPEEVAERWAMEWAKRASKWTGKGSCRRMVFGCCRGDGLWKGPFLGWDRTAV